MQKGACVKALAATPSTRRKAASLPLVVEKVPLRKVDHQSRQPLQVGCKEGWAPPLRANACQEANPWRAEQEIRRVQKSPGETEC